MWRFGLTGSLAALIDYGSVLLLVALNAWPELARAVGLLCGGTTAYLLNRRWTFHARRDAREVIFVAGAYAATFVLVMTVNTVLVRALPPSWWPVTLAWVLSQCLGTSVNFLGQRFLVFQHRPEPHRATAAAEHTAARSPVSSGWSGHSIVVAHDRVRHSQMSGAQP